MLADKAEGVAEQGDVLAAQGGRQETLHHLDVAGHHPAEQNFASTTPADAINEPVDTVLNLVAAAGSDIAASPGLIRTGGVIVATATPATGDPDRGVCAVAMQLRTDADRLASLAALVDA
ncbi:hypothetical protein ACIP79_12995 [Streptomyces sp. NPDC088747]|uniref:hypothetical protein n=1 Tax=Streptomyces sp. NPDC088747 TaxID=3365886 RepID=UPI0037F2C511